MGQTHSLERRLPLLVSPSNHVTPPLSPPPKKIVLTISQHRYKNNATGRVNAVYPGSSLHYQSLISTPRYEDFSISYHSSNPFAFLGMGWTVPERLGPQTADCSPYLTLDNIDPKWFAASGGDVGVLKQQREEARERAREGGDEGGRRVWIERRI